LFCVIYNFCGKKQLVNCCAAYQAMLQQRQENGTSSIADEEDQLDIDMVRLSAAVQAVDGMLDEIDRLLKVLYIHLLIIIIFAFPLCYFWQYVDYRKNLLLWIFFYRRYFCQLLL